MSEIVYTDNIVRPWDFMRFETRKVRGRLYEISLVESSHNRAVGIWQEFCLSVPGGKLYVLRDTKPRKGDMFSKLEVNIIKGRK